MNPLVVGAARLSLRPVGSGDLAWMHAFNALPEVRQYLFDDETWSLDEVRVRLIERNAALWSAEGVGLFVMSRNDDAAIIGWCGFWYYHEPPVREVCYAIHPDHWGRGYAQEAMEAVMRWGAEARGFHAFHASVDEPNTRSQRLLMRLGFTEILRSMGNAHPLRHYIRTVGGRGAEA